MSPVTRYARRILGLLTLANLFNFYDRQIVSVLAETIKVEFQLTDVQVAGLNSAFEFTYPLAAILLAMLADRWGRQRIISLVVALWSGATALTGVAGSYLILIVARLGVGVGQGGYGPSALTKLSEVFPGTYRAQAVGFHAVGLVLGSAMGYILSGVIAQTLGWRVSFIVAGLPGLLLAWFIFRLQPKVSPVSLTPSTESRYDVARIDFNVIRQLFTVSTLRLVYASGVLVYLATGGLIFWLPTFMQRYHGYTQASAASIAGVVQVVMGVGGVLFGGWLGDRLTQRHPGGKLITMGMGLAVGTPLGILGILASSRLLFLVAAGVALFLYSFNFSCSGPQIYEVTPPAFRATSQAVFLFLTHYLGNLPSAPIIGWLSDAGYDLRTGMIVLAVVGIPAAVIMLWGARFAAIDVRSVGDITE